MALDFTKWLTRYWEDDEQARYELYQYLQETYKELDACRLFPVWEDVYLNYTELKNLDAGVDSLLRLPAGELKGLDISSGLQFDFGRVNGHETLMRLQERLRLARPLVKKACKNSEHLREERLNDFVFEPVGLWVQNTREGVLILKNQGSAEAWSWQFRAGLQKNAFSHTAIDTRFIGKFALTLSQTIMDIKRESLKRAGLENAVVSAWYGESSTTLPVFHTLKPLGVFKLMETLDSPGF